MKKPEAKLVVVHSLSGCGKQIPIQIHIHTYFTNILMDVFKFSVYVKTGKIVLSLTSPIKMENLLGQLDIPTYLTCSRHQSLQIFKFQFSKSLFLFLEGGQENIFHWS